MSKSDTIKELEEEVTYLKDEYQDLLRDYMRECNRQKAPQIPIVQRKKEYAGDVCFDYWPLSDWFRFGVQSKWKPGRYFQFVAGPLRVEFFEA